MKIQSGLVVFIVLLQAMLFLTHLFLYETWTFSTSANEATGAVKCGVTVDFVTKIRNQTMLDFALESQAGLFTADPTTIKRAHMLVRRT